MRQTQPRACSGMIAAAGHVTVVWKQTVPFPSLTPTARSTVISCAALATCHKKSLHCSENSGSFFLVPCHQNSNPAPRLLATSPSPGWCPMLCTRAFVCSSLSQAAASNMRDRLLRLDWQRSRTTAHAPSWLLNPSLKQVKQQRSLASQSNSNSDTSSSFGLDSCCQ